MSTLRTIQIVLDANLLRAVDRRAKQINVNRSAFIREALRRHLKEIRQKELEARDRAGHMAKPQAADEILFWEWEAAGPEE